MCVSFVSLSELELGFISSSWKIDGLMLFVSGVTGCIHVNARVLVHVKFKVG